LETMKITHGPSPAPTKNVLGLRRAVDEVPRAKPSLVALDQQQALAGQDEEVLLARLTVIEGARLSRLHHAERVSDLSERRCAFAFEGAGRAEAPRS
jgi:hypothetical protein